MKHHEYMKAHEHSHKAPHHPLHSKKKTMENEYHHNEAEDMRERKSGEMRRMMKGMYGKTHMWE